MPRYSFFSDYAIKYISNFMTRSRLSFAAENMKTFLDVYSLKDIIYIIAYDLNIN